ncbi:cytochrome c oxidase subunit 2 [Silvimonas terrae]|uniref:Nitrous-oxide reductase n=1 Tax=Silvimonas terrae TaxID=300266 RepID=A0A840RMK6_9NEIS|nr:cupredoxin domain-containing protein [Silvimonas terrae]MBB5193403.1 cytochrome c oxidase subunit 2 [Silvimonas terrae]
MTTRRQFLRGSMAALSAGALTTLVAAAEPKVVRISAKRFVYTPATVAIPANQPVVLEVTVSDVVMGFSLPDLKLRTDLVPGQTARLTLPALPPGEVVFLCDVFCGSGHEDMSGVLKVG